MERLVTWLIPLAPITFGPAMTGPAMSAKSRKHG